MHTESVAPLPGPLRIPGVRSLRQTREPPAHRGLQGARWHQPGGGAERGGAPPARHHRLDGQPRAVHRLRRPAVRGARHAPPGGGGDLPRKEFDEAWEHVELLAAQEGYRYIHSATLREILNHHYGDQP